MSSKVLCMIICVVLILLSYDVYSQEEDFIVFGYSGTLTKQLLGICLYRINYDKLGFYIDFKADFFSGHSDEDNDFYGNISVNKAENIFGDRLISKESAWSSMNIGVIKKLINDYYYYFAGGFSVYTSYRKYKDDLEMLGNNGNYWIEDENKSKTLPNIMCGIFLPYEDKYMIQIGANLFPSGLSVGFGYKFK